MKFIDLFAGVGGFHFGLKENECVYSNEWDKYANSVYRKHFGECDATDIRIVRGYDIPDHELLCAGFPCQSFSMAGKRGGFDDTRGTLFFEICRIANSKRPRLLLLENVKGLLSHDNGKTFYTIIRSLDELGYDCEWQVLNSKNFGVPQNRERVFIIGNLRGTSRPKVFPIIGSTTAYTQSVGIIDKSYPTITPLRFLNRNQKNFGNKAMTVDTSNSNGITIENRIRRLTPIECERLQGFPDNWTKFGADGELISDTQRYKMMGNAVTTNVISFIGSLLNGEKAHGG